MKTVTWNGVEDNRDSWGDKGRLEECYLNWQFGSLLESLNEFDM